MFFNLNYIIKSATKYAKINGVIKNQMDHLLARQCYSKNATSDVEILEVDIDKMMHEDNDNDSPTTPSETISSTDLSGIPLAPIDIDPWVDEELEKDGTVDMEYTEKSKEEIHYPEPPKVRSGFYEFEGIKIWLPPKMLSPSTYRYRLDEGEEETLPDDIRICNFENFKPSSKE